MKARQADKLANGSEVPDGSVYAEGTNVDYNRIGVRPAMWVRFGS